VCGVIDFSWQVSPDAGVFKGVFILRDLLFPPYTLLTRPTKITKLPFGKQNPDS